MKSETPLADITATARAGLSGSWGKSIGVMLVYILLLAGVRKVPMIGSILTWLFAAPMVVGLHAYFLATVRKGDNPFNLLFEGFNRFGTSWCAYALVVLIITAWMLPFIALAGGVVVFVHPDLTVFPGYTTAALAAVVLLTMCGLLIVLQIRYYLVLYIVADDPAVRARNAVRRSVEMMSGNYWRLCLLGLRFIGWQILCVLTFGIGFIWLVPYMSAATAAFYDDLS